MVQDRKIAAPAHRKIFTSQARTENGGNALIAVGAQAVLPEPGEGRSSRLGHLRDAADVFQQFGAGLAAD
jgi:hypothetical protein